MNDNKPENRVTAGNNSLSEDTLINQVGQDQKVLPENSATEANLGDFNSSSTPVGMNASQAQVDLPAPATEVGDVDMVDPSGNQIDIDHEPTDGDTPIGQRTLRKRKEPVTTTDSLEEALKPLTEEARRAWTGWVELESDPVSS